jgi:hypothetical protein
MNTLHVQLTESRMIKKIIEREEFNISPAGWPVKSCTDSLNSMYNFVQLGLRMFSMWIACNLT